MEHIIYPNQDFYFMGNDGLQMLQVTEGINDAKPSPRTKRGRRRQMAKFKAYRDKMVNTLKSSGLKVAVGGLVKRR